MFDSRPARRVTAAQQKLLTRFLEAPERPKKTMTYPELAGFLFTVVSCPDLVKPSEWIPEVFRGKEARYRDLKEASAVLDAMMTLYNQLVAARHADRPRLPRGVPIRAEPMANLEPRAPLSAWARGFSWGQGWLEESWEILGKPGLADTEIGEELGADMLVLSFFATRKLAAAFHRQTASQGGGTLAEMAATMVRMVPRAMKSYTRLGRLIQDARARAEERIEAAKKISRNDPCTCGSGKKFKRCCGRGTPESN
jgi:uncharacterized protein